MAHPYPELLMTLARIAEHPITLEIVEASTETIITFLLIEVVRRARRAWRSRRLRR